MCYRVSSELDRGRTLSYLEARQLDIGELSFLNMILTIRDKVEAERQKQKEEEDKRRKRGSKYKTKNTMPTGEITKRDIEELMDEIT